MKHLDTILLISLGITLGSSKLLGPIQIVLALLANIIVLGFSLYVLAIALGEIWRRAKARRTALIVATTILLSYPLHAAEITLQWDANPASEQITEYRVYEQQANGSWLLVSSTASDVQETTITVPSVASRTFALTAVNISGESDRGEPASTPALPTPPKGGKVKGVKLTLQMSRGLEEWEPVMTAMVPWEQRAQFKTLIESD